MKTDEEVNVAPSMLITVPVTTTLFIFGVFAVLFFGLASMQLISDITSYPPSISFDKGSFYGLGTGVGMLMLVYLFTSEFIFKKKLTKRAGKIFNKMLIICLVTTLGLPHIVHYAFSHDLESKGYIRCDEMSTRWLHDRTIVYVQNGAVCEKLIADKANN